MSAHYLFPNGISNCAIMCMNIDTQTHMSV